MKLTNRLPEAADPRVLQMPLDDELTAAAVQRAPTSEQAWRALGLPGDVDYTTELVEAANAVLPVGDAIGKGLVAFGALGKHEDVPEGWVDRMVTLYLEELEAFWALDAIAYQSSKVHGWTVTTPTLLDDDPAGRIAQRARWIAEESKPPKPAPWYDRLLRDLATDADARADEEMAKHRGRELVKTCVKHRFTHWGATRETGNG